MVDNFKLNQEQHNLLKRFVKEKTIHKDKLPDENNSVMTFLCGNELIKRDGIYNSTTRMKGYTGTYSITQKGRDFLSEKRKEAIKYWLPHLITGMLSLIAVIISLFSLLKQQ